MNRPLALALGLLASVVASAETAAPPRTPGVYPLKPGIFVAEGTDCRSPPNAAIKMYDGKGIGTAHTSGCVAHIVSRKKAKGVTTFEVSQTCNDAGDGSGKPFTEKQTVAVEDPKHFTIPSQDDTRYHYCQVMDLPVELRGAVRPGHDGSAQPSSEPSRPNSTSLRQ